MIVINIILALTSIAYWYITDNWWLAATGLIASVLVVDELFLVVIVLVAVIGYACIYYIWKDIGLYLQLQNLKILAVTFIYMMIATIRGMMAYWG